MTVPCREAGHTLDNVTYVWEQGVTGNHLACYGDITLTSYPIPYKSWGAYLDDATGEFCEELL